MQAPWTLSGNGFMILYKFSKKWIETEAQLPPFLQGNFAGHFGSLMLVDYHTSAVGAYQELLFIPGKFSFERKKYQSISHIYVSSQESVKWGRKNWGIPKELAQFHIEKIAENEEKWTISIEGQPFFEIKIAWKKWHFPITTALMPIKIRQEDFEKKNHFLLTAPTAKGKANLAHIISCKINAAYFPDLAEIKPLLALRVFDFQMTFPVAIEI